MNYACGTCGSTGLVIRASSGQQWSVSCRGGHALVPIPDLVITIEADETVPEQRLALARRALVADGYFTEDEVGDDVAPRISELTSWLRDRLELSTHLLEALAAPDDSLARLRAAADGSLGDRRRHAADVAAENRRRLAGGGAGAPSDAEMALRDEMEDSVGPEARIEVTAVLSPRDDGRKGSTAAPSSTHPEVVSMPEPYDAADVRWTSVTGRPTYVALAWRYGVLYAETFETEDEAVGFLWGGGEHGLHSAARVCRPDGTSLEGEELTERLLALDDITEQKERP